MKQIEYSVYVLGTTHTGWVVVDKDATKEEIEQAIIDDAIESISYEEINEDEESENCDFMSAVWK